MTITVEPIVHHRALARLKDNQSQSNRLKEKSARAQCLIANSGKPCTCGPVPAEPEPAVKLPRVPHPALSQAQRLAAKALKAETIERNTKNDCITLMEEAKACLTKEAQPLGLLNDLKNLMLRLFPRSPKGS